MSRRSISIFLLGGLAGFGAASICISLLAGGSIVGGARLAAPDGVNARVQETGSAAGRDTPEWFVLDDRTTSFHSDSRLGSPTDSFRPLPETAAPPVAMTPEFVERCLEVAAIIQPNLAEGLRALRERDPVAFEQRLRRSKRLLSLADLRDRDPRLFDLKLVELRVDAEVLRLARELRQMHGQEGSAERIQTLESQLLGQVRLQVAFTIHARTDYLCRLQEEVARLERELAQDRERPELLVEQRLRALLGEAYHDQFGVARR